MKRECLSRQRGASLLEMTLVLPVFLMFSFWMIEVGRALDMYLSLNRVAYEGARAANRVSPLYSSSGQLSPEMDEIMQKLFAGNLGSVPAGARWSLTSSTLTGNGTSETYAVTVRVVVPFRPVVMTWLAGSSSDGLVRVSSSATGPLFASS